MTIPTQVRGEHPYVKSIMIILELNGDKIISAEIHKSDESDLTALNDS